MSGVPTVRECSGNFRGSASHMCMPEMDHSAVQPRRENGNYLKWVAN